MPIDNDIKKNPVHLLSIGEILVEIVARSKGRGFLEAQDLRGPYPSGAPAIFIDQAAKMGVDAAIISRIGDDDFGALNLKRLGEDGVNTQGIVIAEGEATGSAFVRYAENGERSFVFNIADSAYGKLMFTQAHLDLIAQCTHLHITGSALAAVGVRGITLEALSRIKAQGGTVSFDPNMRREMRDSVGMTDVLSQILAQTDYFLPSGDELYFFTASQNEAEAVQELLTLGIREIIIKRGKDGTTCYTANGRFDESGLAVPEIDPTGAGDCFSGTYIPLRLQGIGIAEALRYANIAGGHAVTREGPMEGNSTFAELQNYARQYAYR